MSTWQAHVGESACPDPVLSRRSGTFALSTHPLSRHLNTFRDSTEMARQWPGKVHNSRAILCASLQRTAEGPEKVRTLRPEV